MDEKLVKYFESARAEGLTELDLMSKLYGEKSGKALLPDYYQARSQGLTISQAELATLISQELTQRGLESFIIRLESCRDKYNAKQYHKKRASKHKKDEPELKKKSKH
ncbi:hypothetical protein SteCoe_17391 [Stentor coeruleus]|uniref:Uncharacterized protein n=1 Tax=Stentor coeruleus TaxID=5963 RepID=A0A1R2BYZ5_9CILI|nr:hypothetical protein SteCoe_17391 [Stentor coeruleus]